MSLFNGHLNNQIKNPGLISDNTLHVIGVISNPVRYHSRYRIAREWIAEMAKTPNVKLHIVETAFGDRQHELAEICELLDVDYLPLRTRSEIWIKESMINVMARRVFGMHPRAQFMAWIDADISFRDPNWATETIQQLQHFPVIQPWSDCADLGPMGNVMQLFKSFGYQHQRRQPKQKLPTQPYQYAHTGFAWACTRAFFENVGGLMDFPILGSADHHMAFAMIGEVVDTIHGKMSEEFKRRCFEWQARAVRVTHKEVGFVMGRIEHTFHGPKKRRYYRERWAILYSNGYNPDTDTMYDSQGLIQLVGKPSLEQEIRLYNRSRFEDSIEEN